MTFPKEKTTRLSPSGFLLSTEVLKLGMESIYDLRIIRGSKSRDAELIQ